MIDEHNGFLNFRLFLTAASILYRCSTSQRRTYILVVVHRNPEFVYVSLEITTESVSFCIYNMCYVELCDVVAICSNLILINDLNLLLFNMCIHFSCSNISETFCNPSCSFPLGEFTDLFWDNSESVRSQICSFSRCLYSKALIKYSFLSIFNGSLLWMKCCCWKNH